MNEPIDTDELRELLKQAADRIGHDCDLRVPCLTCRIDAALSASPAEPEPTTITPEQAAVATQATGLRTDFAASPAEPEPTVPRRLNENPSLPEQLRRHQVSLPGHDARTMFLLGIAADEIGRLAASPAEPVERDEWGWRGVWHVRHADGTTEDIVLEHGNLVEDNTGSCGQFLLSPLTARPVPVPAAPEPGKGSLRYSFHEDGTYECEVVTTPAVPAAPTDEPPRVRCPREHCPDCHGSGYLPAPAAPDPETAP